jgi:hypothetical protein
MPTWKLSFSLNKEQWTNEVKSTKYRTLKREIDTYFPGHRYEKLDFIPQQENKEDGLFTIVENLTPIGVLEITQL